MPSAGDPFRWRVSVAHIGASGPFSEFAAHDRKMVLLQGAGIELSFADGVKKTLRQVGEVVEFDGAIGAHCELLSGPCVDLNLMILKSDRAAVRVERIIEATAVSASLNETTLVFPIDRAIALEVTDGQAVTLQPWDLAILSNCHARVRSCAAEHSAASADPPSAAVFVATLKFVGGEQQAGLSV